MKLKKNPSKILQIIMVFLVIADIRGLNDLHLKYKTHYGTNY